MFNTTFYNDSIKKYTALFGTLFNNIKIQKNDGTANGVSQTIAVPLNYSPKDKLLERFKADPDFTRKYAVLLPRMGFEISSFTYDSNRKLQTTLKVPVTSANGSFTTAVYNPIPYNIGYTLSVYSKNETDGSRIVEQIIPYFTPAWTPTVEIVPGYKIDIPINLLSVSLEDTYIGKFDDENRAVVWTLDFELKGYFFGPITNNVGKVIKFTQVNFHNSMDGPTVESIHIKPGLTANGEPTTSANNSIPYLNIDATDNYGYIVEIVDG